MEGGFLLGFSSVVIKCHGQGNSKKNSFGLLISKGWTVWRRVKHSSWSNKWRAHILSPKRDGGCSGKGTAFQFLHPTFSGLHLPTVPYLLGLPKGGQDWGSIQMPGSIGNISRSNHHNGSLLNGFLTPHSSYRARSSIVSFSHEPFRGYCFGSGMVLHRRSLWWTETAQVIVGIQRERERQEEKVVPGFPSMACPYGPEDFFLGLTSSSFYHTLIVPGWKKVFPTWAFGNT